MPISVKGARLDTVNLEREDSTGNMLLKGSSYCLISSLGKVLANVSIGGYNDKVKIPPSQDTLNLLRSFITSYQKDIDSALGLEE